MTVYVVEWIDRRDRGVSAVYLTKEAARKAAEEMEANDPYGNRFVWNEFEVRELR